MKHIIWHIWKLYSTLYGYIEVNRVEKDNTSPLITNCQSTSFHTFHGDVMVCLRYSISIGCLLLESHSGTSLPSQCSSVPFGWFCLSSSCAPELLLWTPLLIIREFYFSCCQGVTLHLTPCACPMLCVCDYIIQHFFVISVPLNAVQRRTPCWAWPSWCPILLWDCSTCANFTWEAMLLFRMRTLCTGEVLLLRYIEFGRTLVLQSERKSSDFAWHTSIVKTVSYKIVTVAKFSNIGKASHALSCTVLLPRGVTEGITLLLLALQTGLLNMQPSHRTFLLSILLFIVVTSTLQSMIEITDPVILALGASKNRYLLHPH